VQKQERQQRTLARTAQRQRPAVADHLQRAKDPELHLVDVA
jgi:hypothetical protein